MTASETKELSVSFARAFLVAAGRSRKQTRGSARFRCTWSDSAARVLGWKEPDGMDDVIKREILRATRITVQQSTEEIYRPGGRRVAEVEQLEPMLVDGFRLVRRTVEPGIFATTVFLTVHFSQCPDALAQLEQFITCVQLPPSLKISFLPKVKQPEQIASKEMQTK